MGNEQISGLLKAAGVTAGVLTAATLLVVGFIAYRNFFEVKKLKLEIQEL